MEDFSGPLSKKEFTTEDYSVMSNSTLQWVWAFQGHSQEKIRNPDSAGTGHRLAAGGLWVPYALPMHLSID